MFLLYQYLRTIRLLILAVCLSAACSAQYHDLDPALEQAAKEYDKAQIEGDREALNRLVANDYLIIRGNGHVGDKATLLEVVAGKGMKNDPYTVEKPFQRVYGDTAILGGWVHLTATDHGKHVEQNARFADTWARRDGKWQVVFTSVVLSDKP
jgi:ketosteroid isomerase-like protein